MLILSLRVCSRVPCTRVKFARNYSSEIYWRSFLFILSFLLLTDSSSDTTSFLVTLLTYLYLRLLMTPTTINYDELLFVQIHFYSLTGINFEFYLSIACLFIEAIWLFTSINHFKQILCALSFHIYTFLGNPFDLNRHLKFFSFGCRSFLFQYRSVIWYFLIKNKRTSSYWFLFSHLSCSD